MWPDPQFPEYLVTLLKKFLMENFIFCVVILDFASVISSQKSSINGFIAISPLRSNSGLIVTRSFSEGGVISFLVIYLAFDNEKN